MTSDELATVQHIQEEYNIMLMSVEACARLLCVSETTVKRLIYAREIQAAKIGGNWKVLCGSAVAYYRARINTVLF